MIWCWLVRLLIGVVVVVGALTLLFTASCWAERGVAALRRRIPSIRTFEEVLGPALAVVVFGMACYAIGSDIARALGWCS